MRRRCFSCVHRPRLNDVNDLVNLYREMQHHLEELVRKFKWALSSREVFRWLSDTPPHTLTDIQRAARFSNLQQNCFGGPVPVSGFNEERAYASASALDEQCGASLV